MAELVQSIRIELDDAVSAGIKRATAQTKTFNSNLNRASKTLKNMGKASVDLGKKLGIGLTAPIAAAGVVMVKTAIDAEETANKFNVVFKDVAKQSKEVANALAKDYGMSSEESQKLLSNTGDLLTGFGMSGKAALSMSEDVQKLAADLGSFNNISAERASQALTSGLLGEREAMKSLGIVINEEMVKNMVEAMTVAGKFTEETEQQRKAIATLKLATMQSGNAIGDFARSQGSLANQIKILKAQASDLSAEFGAIMIPIVLDLINAIKPLISRFKNMSPEMKKTVVIISALVAAIGPLLIALGSIKIAIGALLPIISGLGAVFGFVGSVVSAVAGVIGGPIILVVAALAAGALVLIKNWEEFKQFFIAIWDAIVASVQFADQFIKGFLGFSPLEKIKESWEPVKEWFNSLWEDITMAFNSAMDSIKKTINSITDKVKKVTQTIKNATGGAAELGAKVRGKVGGFFSKLNPFGDDDEEETIQPARANAIASESNINNNNNVIVNLAVDKNGNPILESASSDNGLNNVDVNMGLITP
tara:strand:+ start:6888 stop:8495 length:1608 start_codon:yes stop_codon:yes gene_type:complete